MTMFEPASDLTVLAAALQAHFGDREFTIEQAGRFTLVETPYAPAIHLEGVLRTIEGDGHLDGRHPAKGRRRNTYPEGTFLRFRP